MTARDVCQFQADPELTPEDISAALAYAAEREHEVYSYKVSAQRTPLVKADIFKEHGVH